MAFDNTITIVGNLTRDPELRFTPSGAAVTTFGVAWNQRSGDGEEKTSFFDVTCWRQLAENAAESLTKGMRVMVYGRLDQRSWETQDGEKRSKVEIVADEVAPSLRWATAQVTRNDRSDGGSGGGSAGGGGGQNRGSGGDMNRGGGRSAAPQYETDEEPF